MKVHMEITHKIIKYYPYRSALLESYSIRIPLEKNAINQLNIILKRDGFSLDNHICFEDEAGTAYMFSDKALLIGKGIHEVQW